MRRGSVVGPLILIGIGTLFLLNNVRPDLSLVHIIGRFWPFLLIGWGVLRLLEILVSAWRRKPLPAYGVSGGEWVLIFFICVIGSGAFFASRAVGHWPPHAVRIKGLEVFGEPFDFQLSEQRLQTEKTPRVIVENLRGSVRIKGGDTDEVRVSGRKTVRSLGQEQAEDANRITPLEVIKQGENVLIRTNQERAKDELFVTADLEITIPRGASVKARGRHGDFDLMDLDGDVEITSDNAGVRVHDLAGSLLVDLRRSDIVRAIAVKGNVELRGRGSDVEMEQIGGQVTISGMYAGDLQFRNLAMPLRYDGPQTDLRLESCPGTIRMARGYVTGENLIGPVVINARSKDVELSGFTHALELNLDRGDIDLRPGRIPLPKMDVQTRAGTITLALPEEASFAIRASVRRGEVRNDYGEPLTVESEGRGERIVATVGTSGPMLTLRTERGEVIVKKGVGGATSVEAPVAPKPTQPARPPQLPRPPRTATML